ncbi:trypsin-like serine protease [Roseateles sp. DAIF2]|uniref:trypsin-like serine peptidase n=1 Tax=Roseateles sp. DAIF2 TaxID=2714952 RepID=UPI0018A304A0|nr:trypsin-like serine protease [Roseateles sp. DAIF2]QPF74099.1 trypsin-like serine protease [Roseateles sp. DAIF2]
MNKPLEARLLAPDHEGDLGPSSQEGAQTEYESLPGLNFNVADPHAEARSGDGRGEAAGTEHEGAVGGSESAALGSRALLDPLGGSYELRESGQLQPEVIIGTDDRVRVGATGSYPWRAICALRITAANGRQYIGTGWFISPRTVITAGHCVFMHNEGGWARSIEVIPGLNDASRPFGSASSGNLRSVTGWTQSRNREFDYGAIILPANARLGERTGWFGLAVRDDAFLRAANLNLSGYPGDKGGSQQWFMAQRTKSLSARVITYDIDTMGGQSGSPVWVLQNGQRYGVGVHTNGHGSGNSATRIETNVYNRMVAWKNEGQ